MRITAIIITAAMLLMSASYILSLFAVRAEGLAGSGLVAYAAESEGAAPAAPEGQPGDPAYEKRLSDLRAQERIEKLGDLIYYLRMNYKDSLDLNDLANGAIEGIMSVLGDKYSRYFYAEDVSMEELFSDLENE